MAGVPGADKAVEEGVNLIKHHFRYLSQYDQNMANLSTKVKSLEDRKDDVHGKVSIARNNDETIKDSVISWLEKVETVKEEAKEVLKEKERVGSGCWKGWCVNMKVRYSLSKKAIQKAGDLDTFLLEGAFQTVAHPKDPLAHVYNPMDISEIRPVISEDNIQGDENSEANEEGTTSTMSVADADGCQLRSRVELLHKVMTAVKDPTIRMVRICGMGGVGKTTMAKEVEQIPRKDRLFHEIGFVEVNQDPDLKILQRHIAELFGLKFEEENELARAKRLRERLSGKGQEMERVNAQGSKEDGENKKILLILDNIWKREHLEEAGIPIEDLHSRCKILLTSRENLVCKNLEAQKEFRVDVLLGPEARILFKISLGISPCYDPIAEEIVKACGGLPISIKTIARALANREEGDWIVALRKLQNSVLKGEYADVLECLEISYNFLKDEKIKEFFRLCCLFRKGSNVPIEDLARYGMALRLFSDPNSLHKSRDEAWSYVRTLLHSNFLLSFDETRYFKVHDHVWDFALSVSSNNSPTSLNDSFTVNHSDALTKWPRQDSYKNYTSISLQCGEMFQVPEELDCPNLMLLQLTGVGLRCSLEIPKTFFQGMARLNVLDFSRMYIKLIPKSLHDLRNLRSLSLSECFVGDISMIGDLGMLEVLSFAHSKIKELPAEISKLKELRLLDLTGCKDLRVVAPGLLSQLTSLEELYMRGTLIWRQKGSQEMFSEIAKMSTLEVLDIQIS